MVKNFVKVWHDRITPSVVAFVLVLSSVAASVPLFLSQTANAATTVNDQASLVAAIAGGDSVIELGASFSISNQVNINRTLTLNGNGYTLSAQSGWSGSPSNDSILAVTSGNPTINNIVIDGAAASETQGVQVWNGSAVPVGATLNNVTVRNNQKAGIHVNTNSTVTVNNVTTSNNSRGKSTTIPFLGTYSSFGGILVSGGTATITGQSTHISEGNHIRRDGGTVVDVNSQYTNLVGFLYTLKSAPVAPSFTTPTPSHNSTITDSNSITIAWDKPTYASTFNYRINGGSSISSGAAQSFTQNFANGTHTVEVQSVAASGLAGAWSAARTFTVNVYNYNTNDSQFIGSPKYVQANGAHASHNISAEVHVPAASDSVRFFVNGSATPVAGTYHNAVNANTARWRLITPLAPGEHTITAEYQINGVWYATTGSGIAYSLTNPALDIQLPNDTKYIFRGSDNAIVRVKISDKYNSFSRADFVINGTTYSVTRDTPGVDLRQAGNYVIVDITKAPNWNPLTEGTYTATVNAWNKANGRASSVAAPTRSFIIDNVGPQVTDFATPAIASSSVTVSAKATDNHGIESVKFYIAQTDADGVCKNNLPAILEAFGTLGADNTYTATFDTSGLNGVYCALVSAKDVATHNSTPLFSQVLLDNTAPQVSINSLAQALFVGDQPTLTGTLTNFEASDSFVLRVNGTIVTPTISGNTWTYKANAVTAPSITVVAEVSDAAGNTGSAFRAFLVTPAQLDNFDGNVGNELDGNIASRVPAPDQIQPRGLTQATLGDSTTSASAVAAAETEAVDGEVAENEKEIIDKASSAFQWWWLIVVAAAGLFFIIAWRRRKADEK